MRSTGETFHMHIDHQISVRCWSPFLSFFPISFLSVTFKILIVTSAPSVYFWSANTLRFSNVISVREQSGAFQWLIYRLHFIRWTLVSSCTLECVDELYLSDPRSEERRLVRFSIETTLEALRRPILRGWPHHRGGFSLRALTGCWTRKCHPQGSGSLTQHRCCERMHT